MRSTSTVRAGIRRLIVVHSPSGRSKYRPGLAALHNVPRIAGVSHG